MNWPPGEQMNVKMKDGLAAVGICIYDDAVTIIGKTGVASDICRG